MRVLIVSDTHRRNDNYLDLLDRLHPIDMVIHCGDAEGSEYAITEAANCPVMMVRGNNDFFAEVPRELEFNIDKYKVWVTHGHNYRVNMGTEALKQEARSRGVDIVLYGHTHKPRVEKEDDLIVVNPGSISYPRQDGRKPSYAIMELDRFGEVHFHLAYLDE